MLKYYLNKKSFLLAAFICCGLLPIASQSRGPIQPEYASFESPGSTDMVDLLTGDFAYTLPLVNVPGPGGGYTMALSYHAGIELQEESSWVGLGWSLNPGAITRNINQYPDDFSGETLSHDSQSPGGSGYSVNWGVYSKSFDSNKGRGGRVGLGDILSVGYGNQNGLTAIGVAFNFNNGDIVPDPVRIMTTVMSVALAIPTGGASVVSAVATTAVSQVSGALIGNAIAGSSWDENITNENMIMDKWRSGTFKMKKNYRYYFKVERADLMYGSLYLGETQVDGKLLQPLSAFRNQYTPRVDKSGSTAYVKEFVGGAVSDVSYNSDSEYQWGIKPVSLAYDNYNVFATGVGGSIAPYRPDVGSVAFSASQFDSFSNTEIHTEKVSYSIKNWLDSESDDAGNSNPIGFKYKTQFKYTSELSNAYSYHNGNSSIFDKENNTELSVSSNVDPVNSSTPFTSSSLAVHPTGMAHYTYELEDSKLYQEDLFLEADRTSDNTFLNGKLATGKYIQYFTNNELEVSDLSSDDPTTTVYQDHMGQTGRLNWRGTLPDDGIGGFVITNTDGTSYHFTIPVYQIYQYYFSGNGIDENNSSSYYSRENYNKAAVSWLLTGITGPDYIDRGVPGVIDEEDWGYWVKLDYGRMADDYRFRSPYKENVSKISDGSNDHTDFMRINTEQYYLNTIQTSTHTALFIKDIKEDGRAFYNNYVSGKSLRPSSTLKLEEVIILKNEDFEYIVDNHSGGTFVDYINGPSSVSVNLANGDQMDAILDVYDIASDLTFIRQNQIRSIKFNTDYSLCTGTPNSFASASSPPGSSLGSGGKLTLNSVSVRTANDEKIQPDYLFDYETGNPQFGEFKYDGWGFYAANGFDNYGGHYPEGNGDEWSLKKITTPLGSEITIDYERDTYASLSGLDLEQNLLIDEASSTVTTAGTVRLYFHSNIADLTNFLSQGDAIFISKIRLEKEDGQGNYGDNQWINLTKSISAVGTDYVEFGVGAAAFPDDWTGVVEEAGYLTFDVESKAGGDIRVASISVEDESGEINETQYRYTVDGEESSLTSGVCTMEPNQIHLDAGLDRYPQYQQYDFPGPFVMYSKVTVLNNYKGNDDYISKEVYAFEPPSVDHVLEQTKQLTHSSHQQNYISNIEYDGDEDVWIYSTQTLTNYHYVYTKNLTIKTSEIGRLNSISSFSSGERYKRVQYGYAEVPAQIDFDNTGIGYYTEGTILTERISDPGPAIFYRNFFTKKVYVPSKMESFTLEERGHTKTVTNTAWDFITGAVLETEYENTYGDRFRTEMVPAYEKYDGMGHILWDSDNKHMLSKPAASYLYVEQEQNPGNWDLISADAKVWSNQWEYREYNTTNDQWEWVGPYTNDAWRPQESYYWKANINTDGTYIDDGVSADDFEAFNWTAPGSANSHWIKSGEVTHYNHNSVIVENKSNRNIYSSRKTDGMHREYLMASNANYEEAVATGIEEDPVSRTSGTYFGLNSELRKGSGTDIETSLSNVHTGKQSLAVDHGEYGIVYRVHDFSALDENRNYQLSVWVKNAVSASMPTAASCYVQYRSGGQAPAGSLLSQATVSLDATNAKKAGDWYLFTVDVPANTGGGTVDFMELQLNCDGTSGDKIYLDDFRFYPTTASLSTAVYDNGLKTAVLDNLNMATKVTYDQADRAVKTEVEVLDEEAADGSGGFKVSSQKKYNYGRNY